MEIDHVVLAPANGPGFPPFLLAGYGANFERRWLPVLSHWPEGPPALGATHRHRPVGISCIEASGPVSEIEQWCGGTPRGLRAIPGTTGPQRVAIEFTDRAPLMLGLRWFLLAPDPVDALPAGLAELAERCGLDAGAAAVSPNIRTCTPGSRSGERRALIGAITFPACRVGVLTRWSR